jgi:hypothetical protein
VSLAGKTDHRVGRQGFLAVPGQHVALGGVVEGIDGQQKGASDLMLPKIVAKEMSAASRPVPMRTKPMGTAMPEGAKLPVASEKDFRVGMKIGRSEHRVGAVIDAGTKVRRDVQGVAEGDHQMHEMTADNQPAVGTCEGGGGELLLPDVKLVRSCTHMRMSSTRW